jgi:hypothetical protein
MAEFNLRGQAERCRRLARNSTDLALGDSLPMAADEDAVPANAQNDDDTAVASAGSNDQSEV